MSSPRSYRNLRNLVTRLRDDLSNKDFILLYAYNRTGKTRLSMEFKDAGKRKNGGNPDTLYFNAFTEDPFSWENDLDGDSERFLKINSNSNFFAGLAEMEMDNRIRPFLQRYVDFDFKIDTDKWKVSFSKEVPTATGHETVENIKISRGEENIFIWCFFLAITQLVIDEAPAYQWVKYLYIDDPISSLDDNNAIAVASDLSLLLRRAAKRENADPIKVVFSSHHSLFFNVVCNELKTHNPQRYFLHRPDSEGVYTLRKTDDTPFFHHVAMLAELRKASESGSLYTYHFNMLRSILEKTSTFFGHKDFSDCLKGIEDEALFARALNLLSHGKYAIHEPVEMVEDNKDLFRRILTSFLNRFDFDLPEILTTQPATTAP